jgi:hypothetical protein
VRSNAFKMRRIGLRIPLDLFDDRHRRTVSTRHLGELSIHSFVQPPLPSPNRGAMSRRLAAPCGIRARPDKLRRRAKQTTARPPRQAMQRQSRSARSKTLLAQAVRSRVRTLIHQLSPCYLLPSRFHLTTQEEVNHIAKRSSDFNLSETIREFQKSHPSVSATDALAAVKKAHPAQRIKEGTFKATFYKLAGTGKRKLVKRRKPLRGVAGGGGDHAESIMRAGLTFIRLAGGVEAARERLVGLEALIEAAKEVA